jgi:Domain of unknown function (DUF4136)
MRSQAKSRSSESRQRSRVGVVVGLAIMACGSAVFAAAHSEFGRSFPLQTLTTFAFRDQQRATGDPLEGNPIWISDIEGTIRQDLQADGKTEVANPDFYVAFYVEVGDRYDFRIDYATDMADARTRTDRTRVYDASAISYKTSTVIVDVIDARTNRLVWRGYDNDTFSARDPDKTLGQAAHDVMARFEHDSRSGKS